MHRRVLVGLAVFALIFAGCDGGSATSPPQDISVVAGSVQSATVVRVIDGDTIEVELESGTATVRLIGINAPEQGECHADESRQALAELVADGVISLAAASGHGESRSEEGGDTDDFGRLLRYVEVAGQDVNATLLEDGHAITLQRDHPRLDAYLSIGSGAASAGLGLWRSDACGATPDQSIEIAHVEPNPPGLDDAAGGGEFIVVRHAGDEPVQLEGWTLRDESSTHRYIFGAIEFLPSQEYTLFVGCGVNDGFRLFWCAGGPVLSNGGDSALLLDAHGNVVDAATYRG